MGGGVLNQERLRIRSGTLNEPIKGFLNSTSVDLTVSTMRVILKGAFGCHGQSLIKSLMQFLEKFPSLCVKTVWVKQTYILSFAWLHV